MLVGVDRHRRLRPVHRRLLVGFCVFAVLALVALGIGSWVAASQLLTPHHYHVNEDIEVLAASRNSVVLKRTTQSTIPGTYGLAWKGGHALLGPALAESGASVTRQVSVTYGQLSAHEKVGIDPNVWESDPQAALGIPFQEVTVPGPLGPMPAWFVAGTQHTWAIFVHGIDGSPAAGLRILPSLHRAGLPSLLISLRNDVGAPRSPDGYVHLGMTEWQDLDAAARYAVAHGASHLVLIAESMGAAIVTRFMRLSQLAGKVRALVFDAPVLDWRAAISYVASRNHVPFLAGPVEWIIAARINVDWNALDANKQAGRFRVPVLLFQGLSDADVPPSQSAAFARSMPSLVTYVPVPRAGHVESWNVDPTAYDKYLRAFLAAHAWAQARRASPPGPFAGA